MCVCAKCPGQLCPISSTKTDNYQTEKGHIYVKQCKAGFEALFGYEVGLYTHSVGCCLVSAKTTFN